MPLLLTVDNSLEVQDTLKQLRLSVIGDEDEKLALLKSSKLEGLLQLLRQLNSPIYDSVDPLPILDHLLVIIHSLTYYPSALNVLLDVYGLPNTLVQLALKFQDNDHILIHILKTLANILSIGKYSSKIDLNLSIGDGPDLDFKNLLLLKIENSASDNVLFNIFKLLPLLNPFDLQILVFPLIKTLDSLLKTYKERLLALYDGSGIYSTCFENEFVPTPPVENTSTLLVPLLYSLGNLLNFDKVPSSGYANDDVYLTSASGLPIKIDRVLSKDLYFTLTSFLKSTDYELKLSSIMLLINFSTNSTLQSSEQNRNILKILPYLIQLIRIDEKKHTFKIYKSSLNLSRKFNPLYTLSKLSLNFEFVNDFLLNSNILKRFIEVLKKFNSKKLIESNSPYYHNILEDYSDLFLILSSITANNEQNRILVLKDELFNSSEKVLEFHYNNMIKLIGLDENDRTLNDKLELTGVSNQLSVSICYLLRSLSRSVALLRTKLNDSNIIETLLKILKLSESEITTKFQQISTNFINSSVLLKTVILSIISNLVLDFSPIRIKLLNNDLISIISSLLSTTKFNSVKINCLWVIRHVIYKESPINMDQTIDQVGILEIFKYCSNIDDFKIQEQAFNVLRNLTCSKSKNYMINKILTNFKKFNEENLASFGGFESSINENIDSNFFQFLNLRLSRLNITDSKNNGLFEAIIYIIVHIAIIDEIYRDLIIDNTSLLEKIKDILVTSKNIEVKLSCVWLVINLTWVENIGPTSPTAAASDAATSRLATARNSVPSATRRNRGNQIEYANFTVVEEESTADVNDEEGDVVPDQRGRGLAHRESTVTVRFGDVQADTGEAERVIESSSEDEENEDLDMTDEHNHAGGDAGIDNSNENAHKRVDRLNEIGFQRVLKELIENSDNIDLRERIRTALFNLNQFP